MVPDLTRWFPNQKLKKNQKKWQPKIQEISWDFLAISRKFLGFSDFDFRTDFWKRHEPPQQIVGIGVWGRMSWLAPLLPLQASNSPAWAISLKPRSLASGRHSATIRCPQNGNGAEQEFTRAGVNPVYTHVFIPYQEFNICVHMHMYIDTCTIDICVNINIPAITNWSGARLPEILGVSSSILLVHHPMDYWC